ncbi:unnamed protein product [Zymoseptoria tritici ST99CH_1A5]|nr:unnamed protein product [Zymoseptoria tritici ST99CH_3D1]SMY19447.1 unnamed protein product [Zymoseptoria tritici ST99CH_1A5]
MNGGGAPKRRSARLSQEGNGENEPPAKKSKANGGTTSTVGTKQQDGESRAVASRKKAVYDEEADGFSFTKKKASMRAKGRKQTEEMNAPPAVPASATSPAKDMSGTMLPPPMPIEQQAPQTIQKKKRRQFDPTTPERDVPKKTTRQSKRLSNDPPAEPSPQRHAHAKSHANTERSPSPPRAQPVTVGKKRRQNAEATAEAAEKPMTIALPFADTPIIRRNREMRKASADNHRRSSAGMRGKRASSVIDEGRGHALPHTEVPTGEFFKHISAELTEPRRMRCLLGWCGTRAMPAKPDPPKESTPAANLEFQALQAARVIQEELSLDLISNGLLSDWFSRDEAVPPQIPLRKKANPRNIANAAKAEELERELERLKRERAEWDEVVQSAASIATNPDNTESTAEGGVSPLRPDLLDSPQRAIFEQLTSSAAEFSTEPESIQERLQTISGDLEFAVDMFAHGVHTLSTTRDTADRLAEKSLKDAADALEEREKQRAATGKSLDQMNALRGLARVLNSQQKRG